MARPLIEILSASDVDTGELASTLDAMTHSERVSSIRGLPRALLRRLFDVSTALPVTPETFVPKDVPALTPVRHVGTNNMPLFRAFEKPMYRDEHGRIAGRNVQTWQFITGPGYFTLTLDGEPALDYVQLPEAAPAGWPRPTSNSRGFSYFVFRGLRDVMRASSQHVTVGRVFRLGKEQHQYFVLVREA